MFLQNTEGGDPDCLQLQPAGQRPGKMQMAVVQCGKGREGGWKWQGKGYKASTCHAAAMSGSVAVPTQKQMSAWPGRGSGVRPVTACMATAYPLLFLGGDREARQENKIHKAYIHTHGMHASGGVQFSTCP